MSHFLLTKASSAKRESKLVEFKEGLNAGEVRDWCEIIKDVVAMANSGGGIIVFGVDNHGAPVTRGSGSSTEVDPAKVVDQIYRYTGVQFAEIEIHELKKRGHGISVWIVGAAEYPLVFIRPGTYPTEGGKQKVAFGVGTVYFRHGAKSEPGNSEDLRQAFERRLRLVRKEWLRGVRKVSHAPVGSNVTVLPPRIRLSSSPDAIPIRITDSPLASEYHIVDPDITHPYRQKELIDEVRRELPASVEFNSYDVLCIRRVYKIDEDEALSHQPKFGSRQYSRRFIDWILAKFAEDAEFFHGTRQRFRQD